MFVFMDAPEFLLRQAQDPVPAASLKHKQRYRGYGKHYSPQDKLGTIGQMLEGKPQIGHQPVPYARLGQAIELLLWLIAAVVLFASPALNQSLINPRVGLLVPGVSLALVLYAYYVSWRWHNRGAHRLLRDFADAILLIALVSLSYLFATPFFIIIFLPIAAVALTLEVLSPLAIVLISTALTATDIVLGPSYYTALGLGFAPTHIAILFCITLFSRFVAHELRHEHEARQLLLAHTQRLEHQLSSQDLTDASRGEIVSATTHQLMNPIGTISHLVRAAYETHPNQSQRELLHEIDEQARRLNRLISELSSQERLARDGGQPRLTNIVEIVHEIGGEFRPTAKRSAVSLVVKTPAKTAMAFVDPAAVRLALWYLLENAFFYTPAKGRVSLTLQTTQTHVEVIVSDNGPGVDPEDANRIFEAFYRAGRARTLNPSGVGLGLTSARLLAQQQHGTLLLKDTNAKGSTFVLALPRHRN